MTDKLDVKRFEVSKKLALATVLVWFAGYGVSSTSTRFVPDLCSVSGVCSVTDNIFDIAGGIGATGIVIAFFILGPFTVLTFFIEVVKYVVERRSK